MDPMLLIAGAVVSLIVQFTKTKFKTNTLGTLGTVVALSIIGGGAMWYLQFAGLWDSFLQIAVSAGAVYAFILKNITDATADTTIVAPLE